MRRRLPTVLTLATALLGVSMAAQISAQMPARADTHPVSGTPATVSADALPTWQLNGVVWSMATVGNTVYATGSFTKARPPGVKAGGAGEVAAANLFAFDLRTGNRVASFSHQLNAQGLVVSASPDRTRVYVGGQFTTVDGLSRKRIAAFSTATGKLLSFAPGVSAGSVRAIAATNTRVFVGGNFTNVSGTARANLFMASAATGAVSSWRPAAAGGAVTTMVLSPDTSRVIMGGHFTTIDGQGAYGMGAVSTATGAVQPWAATSTIRTAGPNGAITSLRGDGTLIYGSAYAYGPGASFEGTFAVRPDTGAIVWLNDCHGDTYDLRPFGRVLYTVSHVHDCSSIHSFPAKNPDMVHHATAFTTYPTTTNTGPDADGWNFSGWPAGSVLHWFPAIGTGTYTGQFQSAWSITGDGHYVVLGGEFPTVNGVAQQGLTRFSTASPHTIGPLADSTLTPVVTPAGFGRLTIVWTPTWDYDNTALTYRVLRDGATTPITTSATNSSFWQRPGQSFTDSGLTPGSSHTYRIQAVDPDGNIRTSAASPRVTVG